MVFRSAPRRWLRGYVARHGVAALPPPVLEFRVGKNEQEEGRGSLRNILKSLPYSFCSTPASRWHRPCSVLPPCGGSRYYRRVGVRTPLLTAHRSTARGTARRSVAGGETSVMTHVDNDTKDVHNVGRMQK